MTGPESLPGGPPEPATDRRLARLTALDPRDEILSRPPASLDTTLESWLAERSERGYRLDQIRNGLYRQRSMTWEAMTTLSRSLRADLAASFRFPSVSLDEVRESADGTRKYLWRLIDGESVESVLIPARGRDTICVSSQAGCALACSFCATGLLGYRRNLTVGEIVDQVRQVLARRGHDEHGANVVFMGMGEPLLNWENLSPALEILTHPAALDIGARRITVSTVGVPEKIVALGETWPQVRLAVSLHAARDSVRDRIVPLNRRHPLRQVLAACRLWSEATGKRLTFEVIHLPGVNDGPANVAALADALGGLKAQVNLMRYNPVPGADFRRPRKGETEAFRDALRRASDATVTIRRSRGMDIEGACGQLRLARETAAADASTGREP